MRVRKAVITAGGARQRALPLQTLIDRDGEEKSVLQILIEEALRARIEEIGVVASPRDADAYAQAAGVHAGRVHFLPQPEPLGYGHALYCSRDFTGREPFLHLVGDHIYVSGVGKGCAEHLVEMAEAENCSVSGVQPTHESSLSRFGAVAGRPQGEHKDLYRIETVIEKPTPTEAEQRLIVAGLRSGYYLCFFGLHVFTPALVEILGELLEARGPGAALSEALGELAQREQYLAMKQAGRRYDLGVRYGLLVGQLALALSGADRQQVLAQLMRLLVAREMDRENG